LLSQWLERSAVTLEASTLKSEPGQVLHMIRLTELGKKET
jgi:hypothetical protein